MKELHKQIILTVLILLTLVGGQIIATEQDKDAARIMQGNDTAEGFKSAYMHFFQTIVTSSGAERTLEVRAWIVDSGDKQLAEYLTPADIKGQKILMTEDGDNIWMFNAETRRTRKLGSHMKKRKVMGSDFTYEDQSGGKMSEKYDGVLIGEELVDGENCYMLDLIPTPEGPSYSKVRAWISKQDLVARRLDYYQDSSAIPFKRLLMSDIRKVEYTADGQTETKIVPFKMVMTNLEDRTKTVNVTDEIQFGVDIPDTVFNPHNLDS
jgi:outer membrane lipoprotein-sorting protein